MTLVHNSLRRTGHPASLAATTMGAMLAPKPVAHEHGNTDDPDYTAFLERVNARFRENTKNGQPVFTTDAVPDAMVEAYLSGFKTAEDRQRHNCSACKHFIRHYGGLVTIDDKGRIKSAIWHEDDAPDHYKDAIATLHIGVETTCKVTGVFYSTETTYGTPKTGAWQHLYVQPHAEAMYKRRDKTAGQAMAEKREDYKTIQHALTLFSVAVLDKAITFLKSGAAYRSDTVLGPVQWLRNLIDIRSSEGFREQSGRSEIVRNLTWRAIATAPAGFLHPRSSMAGTLLDDLAADLPFEEVKARFEAKMATYQRSQAAPTAGAVKAAEDLVAKLGIATSLPRRFAQLEHDIPVWLWEPPKTKPTAYAAGVFAGVKTKVAAAIPASDDAVPSVTMTWEKFERTMLPEALKIEALVPSSSDRFAALVTAMDPESPPILKWDRPDARNPVSWYYESGADGEIKRRVTQAGGQYENVDIRASLIWNNRNDLDLHVISPGLRGGTEEIDFRHKRGSNGGWLDVDMNVSGETTKPVENIRWARGVALEGRYHVYVQNFRYHEHAHSSTPFSVELEVAGKVMQFLGTIPPGRMQERSNITVIEFDFNRLTGMAVRGQTLRAAALSGDKVWGLMPGTFVEVNAVVPSPDTWAAGLYPTANPHVFFLLQGCRDEQEGVGRGFFNEMLIPELRPARATLEAYSANAQIAGGEHATACGLGFSAGLPWGLDLKVTTATGVTRVKIDRWD